MRYVKIISRAVVQSKRQQNPLKKCRSVVWIWGGRLTTPNEPYGDASNEFQQYVMSKHYTDMLPLHLYNTGGGMKL
ncbi:MAG: hypothetical protein CSA33_05945 [Desulfobulbus propionicus]|nr:MAG: hypothetical protein CSA33_05945 [Desulfobulbus propionicus]